jgi:uncharacterized surface protein with fasciclin (FAS1) repeats
MRRWSILFCIILAVPGPTLSHAQDTLPTIAELIATHDDLTTFQQLLDATDPQIREWLENPDNEFTVFAPTDAAWELYFDDIGVTAEEYMQRATSLEERLRVHIVPMALEARQADERLFFGCHTIGAMLPNAPNFIEWQIGSFLINYETVSGEPLTAANGLIYVIDQVLPEVSLGRSGDHTPDDIPTATPVPRPPRRPLDADDDILTVLADDGRFTVLLQLLAEYPQYQDRLTSDGLYMLFAPTDAVFDQYFADNAPLNSTAFARDSGETFLAYHLLPGYLTPDELFEVYAKTDSKFCTFYRGEEVEFNHEDGIALAGDTPLSGEALLARNGVIYVTEGILRTPFRG